MIFIDEILGNSYPIIILLQQRRMVTLRRPTFSVPVCTCSVQNGKVPNTHFLETYQEGTNTFCEEHQVWNDCVIIYDY